VILQKDPSRRLTGEGFFYDKISNMDFIKRKFFKETVLLLIAVAITNAIALRYHLYFSLNEFDSLVHFAGGATAGLAFIFAYYSSGVFKPFGKTFFGFLFMAFIGTVFIGMAWEIFELLTKATSLADSDYYSDTGLDIVMDLLGALTACLYAFAREVSIEKEQIKRGEING
jgi:hypothetical protein